MAQEAAPGGGNAYGFSPGSGGSYRSYETRGRESIDDTFHWTSHSFVGVTYNDGKADAFKKVQAGLDPAALQQKAAAWQRTQSHTSGIASRLSDAYSDTFEAWSGDDADKAQTTFGHTVSSAQAVSDYSGNMYTGTNQIASAAAAAKGTGTSHNGSVAGFFGNSDGDGGSDEQAYFTLVQQVSDGRNEMPTQVQWQVKTNDDASPTQYGGNQPTGAGVSGVSAPGSGATPEHTSVQSPHVNQPGSATPHGPGTKNPDPVKGPGTPISDPGPPGTGPGSGPISGPGGTGTGSGTISPAPVHIDHGSTLAGLNGGAGAGGVGAGGIGGLGAGGGAGAGAGGLAGVGAGGVGGLGGGAAGLGGAGLAGGALAGSGAGGLADEDATAAAGESGAAGAGADEAGALGAEEAAGAGGRGLGMMPMRGGGGRGGDEDERERSTWLEEDEDVWGGAQAPPSVIS